MNFKINKYQSQGEELDWQVLFKVIFQKHKKFIYKFQVIVSDRDEEVLKNIDYNIKLNKCKNC